VESRKQRPPQGLRNTRQLTSLGFEMALPVVLFMYAGYRLDGWLDTEPWLMSLAALMGVSVGFYSFFRRVMPRRPEDDGTRE